MSKKQKNFDIKLLYRLLTEIKPYMLLFVFCVTLAFILAPISAVRPYLISVMVDDHIFTGDILGLQRIALIYVGFVILNAILRYFFIYNTALLSQKIIKNLRVRVFNKISKMPLAYYDRTAIGQSTTRTINDNETLNNVFTQGVITMAADIISIFAVLGMMFYTSWRLTVISLMTIPFLILATYVFKEKVRVSYQKVRTQLANMNAFLQERISGMRVVQIFNVEEQEMNKFKNINRKYRRANLDSILYYAVFFPVVELISALAFALMVWWGTSGYWNDTITFGALVSFPMFLNMLFRPIRMLADKFNTLQMGLVSAERIYDILDDDTKINNEGTRKVEKLEGNILFEDVRFSYLKGQEVLRNINFEVKPGETLAIIGSTGSGKTSIINILNRFYDIDSGKISIDGNSITSYELHDFRRHFATVLQDVFLFYGTVYDNIRLLDKSITDEEIVEASKLIGAHKFIEILPKGYNQEVLERGANLSMGQRQLISFVRALVHDPDILILDEATSSIDTETESIIQFAIERLIEKRTSIIIAHRLSTIRHADKIMVLDKGEIVEYGTHDILIKNTTGKYHSLYEMQFATIH